jgi:hypothetical protein
LKVIHIGWQAARDGLGPQQQHVHAAIGQTVVAQRPRHAADGVGRTPWLHPGPDALLEIRDDTVGDPRIDVDARSFSSFLLIS